MAAIESPKFIINNIIQILLFSFVDWSRSLNAVRNVEGYSVYFPTQEIMEAFLIVKHPVIW
jgi:hypothetical protein